ncbi:MAG: hypothetical protein QXP32_08700, partial [Nitrososphaeria archaeon]
MDIERLIWGDYDKLADTLIKDTVHKVGQFYYALFWGKIKLLNAFITYVLMKNEGCNTYYADGADESIKEYDVKKWIEQVEASTPVKIIIDDFGLPETLSLDFKKMREMMEMYQFGLINDEGLGIDIVILIDYFMPNQHKILELLEGERHMIISIPEKIKYIEKLDTEKLETPRVVPIKEVDFYEYLKGLAKKNTLLFTLKDFVKKYVLDIPDSEELIKGWSEIRESYIEKMRNTLFKTVPEIIVDKETILLEYTR